MTDSATEQPDQTTVDPFALAGQLLTQAAVHLLNQPEPENKPAQRDRYRDRVALAHAISEFVTADALRRQTAAILNAGRQDAPPSIIIPVPGFPGRTNGHH